MIGIDQTTDDVVETGPEPPGADLHDPNTNDALRKQAEEIAEQAEASTPNKVQKLSLEATRTTLHELRVHEIELQMQNEELRRTQAELEAARAQYFDLFDLAPVGYCLVSELGLIRQVNLTAATLLGVPKSVLLKQPISRFVYRTDQDIYYLCRKELIATNESQTCDLRMVKRDGTIFWARLVVTIAHSGTGSPTFRVTLTDVTERVHLRETLEEKNLELERAKAAADKANLAKSNFLSNMSHELRSPLNAILGFAQLMQSDTAQTNSKQQENTSEILKAGWHLLDLINELLDLPLVESGQLQLTLESIPLNDVLSECQTMMEPQARSHDVVLSFSHLVAPCFIKADRRRLKQIVINLLSNAIKYNRPAGTVALECTLRPAGRVRISVKDTGVGLTPDKLAQLFQTFNRLGQEAKGEEGTGIGLVITKRLAELMGGTIGVESTLGVGSTFWVELLRVNDR